MVPVDTEFGMDSAYRSWMMLLLAALAGIFFSGQLLAGGYVVQPGDTLWSISRRTGVPVAVLQRLNGLAEGSIRVGQRLALDAGTSPPRKETSQTRYRVKSGESLWSIAQRHGMTIEALRSLNRLRSDVLHAGQELIVYLEASPRNTGEKREPAQVRPAPAGTGQPVFSWPMRGKIVERFGTKSTGLVQGISIAAGSENAVRSTAGGEVAYAGTLRGYGRMVIVRHGDGFHSIYAHLSNITVSKGQRVNAGNVLGQAGAIPGSVPAGVHFQLYKKGRAVDPMSFLRP